MVNSIIFFLKLFFIFLADYTYILHKKNKPTFELKIVNKLATRYYFRITI